MSARVGGTSDLARFAREALGTLVWIGLGVTLALGTAVAGRAIGMGAPYPASVVTDAATPPSEPATWLVDGFNLLHVVLLRGSPRESWWLESGRARVVELARGFAPAGSEVVVVFDGPHAHPEPGGAPRVVFAPSADAWILAAIRAAPEPGRVAVVTADRRLAARARHRGAQVVPPGAFAARCAGPELAGGGAPGGPNGA